MCSKLRRHLNQTSRPISWSSKSGCTKLQSLARVQGFDNCWENFARQHAVIKNNARQNVHRSPRCLFCYCPLESEYVPWHFPFLHHLSLLRLLGMKRKEGPTTQWQFVWNIIRHHTLQYVPVIQSHSPPTKSQVEPPLRWALLRSKMTNHKTQCLRAVGRQLCTNKIAETFCIGYVRVCVCVRSSRVCFWSRKAQFPSI